MVRGNGKIAGSCQRDRCSGTKLGLRSDDRDKRLRRNHYYGKCIGRRRRIVAGGIRGGDTSKNISIGVIAGREYKAWIPGIRGYGLPIFVPLVSYRSRRITGPATHGKRRLRAWAKAGISTNGKSHRLRLVYRHRYGIGRRCSGGYTGCRARHYAGNGLAIGQARRSVGASRCARNRAATAQPLVDWR